MLRLVFLRSGQLFLGLLDAQGSAIESCNAQYSGVKLVLAFTALMQYRPWLLASAMEAGGSCTKKRNPISNIL